MLSFFGKHSVTGRRHAGAAKALACGLLLSGLLAGPSSPARADDSVNLVQGSAGMVWMPLLVARQLGYFKAEGLDVNYIIAGGGAKSAQILVGGGADFAATTLTNVITARDQGADIVVVGALLQQYPTDCVLSNSVAKRLGITADSPIEERIKALKGLKVGLGGQGSPADQLIIWLAKKAGLDPNRDVHRIFLGTDQAVIAALHNGAIDSFCYGPPASTRAVSSGDAIFLYHIVGGSDFPEITHFPNAVLATSKRYLNANPRVADRFARAYVKAIEFMRQKPGKVSSTVKPLFAKMDRGTFQTSIDATRPGYPSNPVLDLKDVQQAMDFMSALSPQPLNLSADQVVDTSLVEKAVKELSAKNGSSGN